jgi:hypothetical protein
MAKKIGSKDGKTVIIPDREVPLTRGTPTA